MTAWDMPRAFGTLKNVCYIESDRIGDLADGLREWHGIATGVHEGVNDCGRVTKLQAGMESEDSRV